jgi:hypothetical protein
MPNADPPRACVLITRSTGRNFRIMCVSCEQEVAASIAGAPIGRGYSICGTGDGGIGTGVAGATAKVDACDVRRRTLLRGDEGETLLDLHRERRHPLACPSCRWLSIPALRQEQGSRFELPQRRHQQARRHAASRTDGHTTELDDQQVGRTVVDLGRIRMNGHGREASRLRKLAAQFAPPTVDRRGRDIGSARDSGNRRARHNGSLHQGKLPLVAPMATPLNTGQYSDLGHRHVFNHSANHDTCTVANISAQTVTRQMPLTGCRRLF